MGAVVWGEGFLEGFAFFKKTCDETVCRVIRLVSELDSFGQGIIGAIVGYNRLVDLDFSSTCHVFADRLEGRGPIRHGENWVENAKELKGLQERRVRSVACRLYTDRRKLVVIKR